MAAGRPPGFAPGVSSPLRLRQQTATLKSGVTRGSVVPPFPSTPEIGAGQMLGRYELLMPIAAGGMAMVWAARQVGSRGFQKLVAVKTMLPRLSEEDQFEKMFLTEASLASKIRHPNVVEILDLGEQAGVLFLAMEWIDGVPLNLLMRAAKKQGGVPIAVALRIVMQACAGLHAAHELSENGKPMGLVHRDVSPQNILVTYDGVTKVVDFGVAKATALGEGATRAGQLKGKVSYMAPEQVRGQPIDRRVDVFAMGIVLYALTTGKHPFRKESEGATLFAITSPDPVTLPRELVPNYPGELQQVVLKALEKDRERRFASASELLRALDRVLPPHERGSDQEVGEFVSKLFAEQREHARAALSEALEHSKNHQVQAHLGMPATEGGSLQAGSSALSSTGVSAAPRPTDPTALFGPRPSPKLWSRRWFQAAAGAAICSVAVAALLAGKDRAPPSGAAADSARKALPSPVTSASAAPAPARSAVPPIEAVGSAIAFTSASAPPRTVKVPAVPRAAQNPPPIKAPVPSAAPSVKRSWKQDPGF